MEARPVRRSTLIPVLLILAVPAQAAAHGTSGQLNHWTEKHRSMHAKVRHHRTAGDWHMVRVRKRDASYAHKRWRHLERTVDPWQARFYALSASDRAWARRTGACESGNRASTNTGNGFLGAFQFVPATARAAGFTRLPHLTSWYEQAVRAVRWRNIAGRGQWPVCG